MVFLLVFQFSHSEAIEVMKAFMLQRRLRSVEALMIGMGLAFFAIGSAFANVDRVADTSEPEPLEELPPQEVLTLALSAGSKDGQMSEAEKAAVRQMAIEVNARKQTTASEYARLRHFHGTLMLRSTALLVAGSFITCGSFLIWSGVLWTFPRTKRWIENICSRQVRRAAELDRRESELTRREEALNRREQRLEEQRQKIPAEVEQQLKIKLRAEIEPKANKLKNQELALQKREQNLARRTREAKALLDSGEQARKEKETAQTLLIEADTASGRVSAQMVELQRKEAKIAAMTGELKALIEARKKT